MRSSGIRRGVAVAAVGAMAVVGLLPLAANANTIEDQFDNVHGDRTVRLFAVDQTQLSTRNDGQNTTINLAAGATSDIDTVRFQYSLDAGATWTNIIPANGPVVLTSPNDDGIYSIEWNPASNGLSLPLGAIQVRANGHSTLDGNNHPGTALSITNVTSTFETVSITNGSDLGVWKANDGQHKVVLRGKHSGPGTDAWVGAENPNGFFGGPGVLAPVSGGNWATIYNIQGFYPSAPYGYNAPDQLAFTAYTDNFAPASADTEGFTLYDQVIDQIVIAANPTNPANPATQVPTTVRVLDQKGNPIPGVNVSSDNLLGADNYLPIGTTNIDGFVDTSPAAGLQSPTQSVNDATVQYVANAATGSQSAFDPALGDKKQALTLGAAFANNIVATSNDGNAFDFDENDGDDIQVQVKDQGNGNFDVPNAGPGSTQDLTYHWRMTPFAGEPEVGDSHTLTTENNGLFDIPALDPADFPDGLESGTYQLYASLSDGGTGHPVAEKLLLTVKVGEAAVEYDVSRTVSPVGSTATVNGNLVLEDGTGLANRRISLDVNAGLEYDDDGPTGNGDAVLVSNNIVTTGAGGSFSAQIEDLSNDPNEVELGARLRAEALPATGPSPDGNWDPTSVNYDHFVDFTTDQVPNGAVLDVDFTSSTGGPAGTHESGTVHLEDAFGDDLAGVQVELSLDHGFFTDGDEAPEPGNYDPTPNSLGDSIVVSTNANGDASFEASIGRDTGFDDDNHVIATVSGDADGATDSDTIDWNAANPLNVSEIEVVRTGGQLDPAPTNGSVLYDVYAWDQFGNPVRGVDVSIECTLELGDDDQCPTGAPIITESDLDNGGDALLVSSEAGTFEYLAEATSPNTQVYNNNLVLVDDNPTFTFQETWYTPSPRPQDGASYTIDPENPSTPVPVDEPITVTVEADDQEGNPLPNLYVTFVRTSDSDNDQTFVTDADGIAQYVFEGTDEQCGENDTVTAVVRNGLNGPIVETLVTTITFEKCDVNVSLEGSNSANKKRDILRVTATSEGSLTGTSVHLMARKGGKWVELTPQADRVLTAAGKATFSVKDTNGNKVTKYRAVVDEGDDTQAAQSQVLRRR